MAGSLNKTIKSSFQNVIGPVLFLLFINDLPLFINEAYLDIYADDTTVHTSDKDSKIVKKKLQTGTNCYLTWCLSTHVFINILKTFVMTFVMTTGTWQNLLQLDKLTIFIEHELIREVDNHKILGVIIDKTLSWDKQKDAVCLNITRKITLINYVPNM